MTIENPTNHIDIPELRDRLSAQQAAHVRDFLSPESLSTIRTSLDALFDNFNSLPARFVTKAAGGQRSQIREIAKLVQVDPVFAESEVYRRCYNLASALFERKCKYGHDEAIYKSPASEPVHWHQDQAYSKYDKDKQCLTFWIPLQATDANNGGMEYITERQSRLHSHEPQSEDSFMYQLSDTSLEGSQKLSPHMELGDVCIHTPLSIHRSVPNNSNDTRRAWAIQFNKYGASRFLRWNNIRSYLPG